MDAAGTVFRNWSYAALSTTVSLAVFVMAAWFPNFKLLWAIWSDASIALGDKIILPIRLLESITTNFSVLSATYTVASAILIGINIAFVVYILKRQKRELTRAGVTTGTFGILSGVTGLGCAACGSLIISSLLATFGGAGILALLPLRGGEFGILGVALLGTAMYFLAKHITRPPLCEVTI